MTTASTPVPSFLILTLAVSPNGNWQLEPAFPARFDFPPMALPACDFPTPSTAQDYAAKLLETAGVLTPATGLEWRRHGFTVTLDGPQPAYRASWSILVQNV